MSYNHKWSFALYDFFLAYLSRLMHEFLDFSLSSETCASKYTSKDLNSESYTLYLSNRAFNNPLAKQLHLYYNN